MLPKRRGTVPQAPARKETARPPQRYCQTAHAAGCLVQVLSYNGVAGVAADIVDKLEASVSDNDVVNLLDVAEEFGLVGYPTVLTLAEWRTIPKASILHWGKNSLVVLLGHGENSATIYDPVHGERQIEMNEFRRQFTGVVLVFAAEARQTSIVQGEKS